MPETVLITGANGFIGYATVIEAIRSEYNVRAVVRRGAAADQILATEDARRYQSEGTLSIVIIPDMGKQDAFITPAQGCCAIIHIAAPLGNAEGDLSIGVVASIEAVLHVAESIETVRRIIWTGSVIRNVPFERQFQQHPDNIAVMNGADDQVAALTSSSMAPLPSTAEPPDSTGLRRYTYAKILATHKLHEHAQRMAASANFEIIIMIPGWVMGPDALAQDKGQAMTGFNTNSLLSFLYGPYLSYGLGLDGQLEHKPMLAATVHVNDLAEAHVKAVKVSFAGCLQSFLLCSDGPSGPVHDDAIGIVKQYFPQEAAFLSPEAHYGTIKAKLDASDAEELLLGHAFKPYETIVRDTIGWYKALPGEKRGVD